MRASTDPHSPTVNTSDLLKRVRRIEIKAKGLSQELFAGQYKTAFKGKGMAFSEVREYQPGDDVRDIDWNVTARHNRTYVKVFEEERELTVMLLIDMSASLNFGTDKETKRTLVAELAATVAFSAIENKDKVGVILFTDRVEKYIPPAKGKRHILYIIREILSFTPQAKGTAPEEALTFLNRVMKKRSTAFFISDIFLSTDNTSFTQALKMVALKHDLSAIVVYDRREQNMLPMGLVQFKDPETGHTKWIDTNRKKVRQQYALRFEQSIAETRHLFKQYGIDFVESATGEDFVKPLIRLFLNR